MAGSGIKHASAGDKHGALVLEAPPPLLVAGWCARKLSVLVQGLRTPAGPSMPVGEDRRL